MKTFKHLFKCHIFYLHIDLNAQPLRNSGSLWLQITVKVEPPPPHHNFLKYKI